ncbi:MAG: MFS transporter [Alphaproteobacteria bacterium]
MDAAATATGKDIKIISLIGVGHLLSHFYQLALPGLFPLLYSIEGIGFAELGLLTTALFMTSGFSQPPAGFLVDKVGARPVLIAGMVLISGSVAAFSFAQTFPLMLLLAALMGLGNSVFHPADFSILNGSVSSGRMGRAFGVHGFGGYIGYAAAPVVMYFLGSMIGWREALLAVGLVGLVVSAVIWSQRSDFRDSGIDRGIKPGSFLSDIDVLLRPQSIFAFFFFAFTAMGSIGLMSFGPTALMGLLGTPAALANSTISAQITGSVCGVLLGGVIADQVRRHDLVTAIAIGISIGFLLIIPAFQPSSHLLVVGLFVGFGIFYGGSMPLRDMVVRSITPSGAAGKVFGFTYSGMDFGSALSTAIFGLLLDAGHARLMFVLVAVFMAIGLCSMYAARRFAARRATAAA